LPLPHKGERGGNRVLEVTFTSDIDAQTTGASSSVSNKQHETANRELMDPGESDCLIKTKQRESLIIGLPSL